jgi:hypothetical protein
MYGMENIKFVNAQQAKQTYLLKNIKEMLYKTNASIWYDKICRKLQLTPNYISIKVNEYREHLHIIHTLSTG